MKKNHTAQQWTLGLGATIFVTLFATVLFAIVARAGDQPQWGEKFSRNMVSAETGLPDAFDPKTGVNIKWSVPLGTACYSTPVIASGKVLIGANNEQTRDPQQEGDRGVLLCFDEKDGHFCWQLAVPKLPGLRVDAGEVGIVSPATVEGDRVYIVNNRNEVMCLNLNGKANSADADVIWSFDVNAVLRVRQHDAAHSSILLHGQYLYLCTSNGVDETHLVIRSPDAPSLIVLDKTTGKLVAQDREGMAPRTIHCTWSSPALGEVGGKPLIFFGGGDGVCYAFDVPATNAVPASPIALQRVWRFDCDPTAPKEEIHRWQENRKEGPSNITGMPVFHEGKVYVAAGGDYWHGKHQAWLKCIDASQRGDITHSGEVWSFALNRHCLSTPSIFDGLLYIADCGPTVHCLDARTGQEYWSHAIKGETWGSTLVADGKVYVGTRRRAFYVFAAGKEKRLISEIELDSPMNSSPTAANGVLYVATMQRLYAIAKR